MFVLVCAALHYFRICKRHILCHARATHAQQNDFMKNSPESLTIFTISKTLIFTPQSMLCILSFFNSAHTLHGLKNFEILLAEILCFLEALSIKNLQKFFWMAFQMNGSSIAFLAVFNYYSFLVSSIFYPNIKGSGFFGVILKERTYCQILHEWWVVRAVRTNAQVHKCTWNYGTCEQRKLFHS